MVRIPIFLYQSTFQLLFCVYFSPIYLQWVLNPGEMLRWDLPKHLYKCFRTAYCLKNVNSAWNDFDCITHTEQGRRYISSSEQRQNLLLWGRIYMKGYCWELLRLVLSWSNICPFLGLLLKKICASHWLSCSCFSFTSTSQRMSSKAFITFISTTATPCQKNRTALRQTCCLSTLMWVFVSSKIQCL